MPTSKSLMCRGWNWYSGMQISVRQFLPFHIFINSHLYFILSEIQHSVLYPRAASASTQDATIINYLITERPPKC